MQRRQALKEYFEEGELNKWERHRRVYHAIREGLEELGFRIFIPKGQEAELVAAALYPDDPNWNFEKIHDACYERGSRSIPGRWRRQACSGSVR